MKNTLVDINIRNRFIVFDKLRRLRNYYSNLIISSGASKEIIIWDITSPKILNSRISANHSMDVYSLCIHETYLFSGGSGNYSHIFQWDIEDNFKLVRTITEHKQTVFCIIVHNNYMISSSEDKSIIIYDMTKDFKVSYRLEKAHENRIYSISCKDSLLVSCSSDKSISFWNISSDFQLIRNLYGKTSFTCLIFKYKFLLAGSNDKSIYVWDTSNESDDWLIKLTGHKGIIACLAKWVDCIYSGDSDGVIKIWDSSRKFDLIKTLNNYHQSCIYSMVIKNKILVTGGFSKEIILLDILEEYKVISTLRGHKDFIFAVK